MRDRFRDDSGSPLQPGNALKNKNFDKAVFRILGICIALLLMIGTTFYFLIR